MAEELETCPKCGKGKLRPTGESSTQGEAMEPFRKTGTMAILLCDNPDCNMKKANADMNEYTEVSEKEVKATATDHRYGQVHRTPE